MPELGRFARELRARFWKPSVEEEVRAELAHHLEMLEQDLVARGMPPGEARAAARARFGDVAGIGERCRTEGERRDREARRARRLGELAQDARYALRQLRANPRFTLVTLLTLAIGLGASTTIFGIANAVLLRPLPFPEPGRLVMVYERTPAGDDYAFSEPTYLDWREGTRAFERLAAFSDRTPSLTGAGEPEQLRGAAVTHDFLPALGVSPALGRGILAEEDRAGGDSRVAVIGHGLWQRRFGGDPGIVGRTVELDGATHRVVGVMPPGFDFPGRVEVWTPLVPVPQWPRGDRRLVGVGRLADGATGRMASLELAALATRMSREFPESNAGWSARAQPFEEWFVSPDLRARVLVLLAAVGLLLALACVNVASVLVARAGAREREIAVRAALGAGRGRIVRQLLTESLVLAVAGAAAGIAVAAAAVPLIRHTGSAAVPQLAALGVDWRVMAFALAACVVTGVVFGLAPAATVARGGRGGGAGAVLRGGTRVADGGRLRGALVVASVSLATLLLVSAALVGGSFLRLMRAELGFEPERVLTASIALPGRRYPGEELGPGRYDHERVVAFHQQLERRLAAIPGVRAAGAVNLAPFSGGNTSMEWATSNGGELRHAAWRAVTPGYFGATGIPLVRGRLFDARDHADAPTSVVIDERLARDAWPGADPIGRRLLLGNGNEMTVVGVVGETRHLALDSLPGRTMYFAHAQFPWPQMWITVRAAGDPLALAGAVRREVAALDPKLPLANVQPLAQLVRDEAAEPRLTMLVFAIFATAALALAAVGLYGVVSATVTRRTRELGVRTALGADPGRLVRAVLGQGVRLAAAGVAIGGALAWGAAGFLRAILYETAPGDPAVFAGVAVLLVVVAGLASAGPAWRAARVDPVRALRSE